MIMAIVQKVQNKYKNTIFMHHCEVWPMLENV